MTILNIMLGKQRGGLEQAVLDYAEALAEAGMPHLSVLHPESWARTVFDASTLPYVTLAPRGAWDVLAAWKLRRIAKQHKAKATICHGNRALSLALRALNRRVKIVAVAHNYKTKRFLRADACFAITQHARTALLEAGMPAAQIFHVPNMVRVGAAPKRAAMRTPPIIGSMGRFVPKKAFDLYLDALAQLHARGVPFRGVLGGGGDEEDALRQQVSRHGLDEIVALPGWVQDKDAFFAGIDLFVLPSHHEPFGIVLIEAMAASVPVISTASEGPREILHAGEDGLLTPLNDATALANAMQTALADPALASGLGRAGRVTVEQYYTRSAMAERLKSALATIITGN